MPVTTNYLTAACTSLIMLPLLPALVMAQDAARIEDVMSAEERAATGLDDLTPRELEALNRWLWERGALPAATAPESTANIDAPRTAVGPALPESAEVTQPVYGARAEVPDVVSRIMGEFNGWDGKTVFTLANGQIYQQRRPGRWKTNLVDPEVRVRKSFFGFELEVDGRSIGVRRIR